MKNKTRSIGTAKRRASNSMRGNYETFGIKGYYALSGDGYRNQHEEQVKELVRRNISFLEKGTILDLACGSGEITLALIDEGITDIDAVDPYTAKAYEHRTGRRCKSISFEDIMNSALKDRKYSCAICSFAMHLVEESKLPKLIFELSKITSMIVIITPHKRPDLSKFLMKIREDSVLTQRGKKVRMVFYSSKQTSAVDDQHLQKSF